METPERMQYTDIEKYLPGFLGSVAYFLYMKIYQRLDWKRSFVALFTGVMVSAYLAPEVHSWVPAVREETVGFLVGFLGMKLAEGFVGLDVKKAVRNWFSGPGK